MSSFLGNTDSIFEKCARFLTLNTIQELLTLQEALVLICKKITDNPTELKYRRVKFDSKLIQSQVITAKGGLEFLTGIGFHNHTSEDGSRYLVYGDLGGLTDIDSINAGLKWLDENVAVCLDIVQSLSLDSTGPCADCTIQLRLPNGTKTTGGFHRYETAQDVLSFARCFFTPENRHQVCLVKPPSTGHISEDMLELTLEDLDLIPRAALTVEMRTDAREVFRSTQVSQKEAKVAAQKAYQERICPAKERKEEKDRLLKLFEEDRENRAARAARGGGGAAVATVTATSVGSTITSPSKAAKNSTSKSGGGSGKLMR